MYFSNDNEDSLSSFIAHERFSDGAWSLPRDYYNIAPVNHFSLG